MPDRIIRDELLTSERYWSVNVEAQQLFVHLLLRADSLSRFSGKNFTIRMACYPGHQRNPEVIEKLLSDLHDSDLIRLYTVAGERFIFIPRYRQRLRYTNSKYPSPPNEINDVSLEKSDSSKTQVRLQSAEVKRSEEVPSTESRKKPRDSVEQEICRAIWKSYSDAYAFRYGTDPQRNARVNSQVKAFSKLISNADAPQVAAFFVGHQQQAYVRANHPIALLLRDAEALRTQWATNRQTTETQARLADKTAANKGAFSKLIQEAEDRERTQ